MAPTLNFQLSLLPNLIECNLENNTECFKEAVEVCKSKYPDVFLFFKNMFSAASSWLFIALFQLLANIITFFWFTKFDIRAYIICTLNSWHQSKFGGKFSLRFPNEFLSRNLVKIAKKLKNLGFYFLLEPSGWKAQVFSFIFFQVYYISRALVQEYNLCIDHSSLALP